MSFNRKDLEDDDFNFDDDNSFDFDDDNGDDFKFDDEPADIALDDDAGEFGFEDEDMPDIDEQDEGDGGGVSRTFIIIAGVMILLFVLGLVAVLIVSQGGNEPTPIELTTTAIIIANQTTEAEVAIRGTESANTAATQTAQALIPTETATPTREPTLTPTPPEPTVDETQQSANFVLTQQAFQATQSVLLTQVASSLQGFQPGQVAVLTQVASAATAVVDSVEAAAATQVAILVSPFVPTQPVNAGTELQPGQEVQLTQVATLISALDPTVIAEANLTRVAQIPPTQEVVVIGPEAVAQTATALAEILGGAGGGFASPTPEGTGFVLPTAIGSIPTELPDTGFFDDLATGNANIGLIVLMAFGLVSVILISRWIRMTNSGK